ncbi:MAG: hypothetical protein ACREBS_08405 [Nitrososphaerales archaeon]
MVKTTKKGGKSVALFRFWRLNRLSDHSSASLFAFAAFLSTLLHVLVVGNFLACLGATSAHICARFADFLGERSTSGYDLGRRRTNVGTVLATHQGRHMLFLAVFEQIGTVGRAAIAFPLTVGARLGTGLEFLPMSGMMRMFRPTLGECRTFQCR